jgi:thiamine-monophosphate kinase
MNEFELIAHLTRSLGSNPAVVAGPGDDCAILDLGNPDRLVLFKTDAVVEGVHFTAETQPERVGRKALARCLSDIAAMAGTPIAALVTLALPRKYDLRFVEGIYRGMETLAHESGAAIVRGETTTNPDRILLSISLVGWIPRKRIIRRSGALPGDALFVTGELGGSISGKHLDFEPRLAEARWLAGHFHVHAMLDLSDGLAGDLRHMLNASKAGAELLGKAIPVSKEARKAARASSSAKPPLLAALTDGEDFELLFAVASKDAVRILDAWKKKFPGTRLSCIGKIVPEPGIRLRDQQGVRQINANGYVHFA